MAKYLNNNHLAAVDTETTGLIPGFHEVIDLAVIPLTVNFTPARAPFQVFIRPLHPERLYPEATQEKKEEVERVYQTGFHKSQVLDMFADWYDSVMEEHGTVKFMALGQNYAFDQAFLKDFFGTKLYEQYFHYHYRDTMILAHAWNDIAIMRGEPLPFPRCSLVSLCHKLNIPLQNAHTALADSTATAAVYAKLLVYGNNLI